MENKESVISYYGKYHMQNFIFHTSFSPILTKKNLIKQLEESFDTIIMAKSWLKNSFIHLYYLDDSKMNTNKIQKLQQLQQKIEIESEHIINILFVPLKRYNVQYIFLKSTQMKEAVKVSDFSF